MFEKRMSYVDAYKALVERLAEEKIFVLDKARGWVLPSDRGWSWVFIDSSLGRRRRLFALAHESGHLFCYPKGGQIRRTVTKLRSEDRANEFAIRVLNLMIRQDVSKDYIKFKKCVRVRRKYLRKVYGGQELNEVREYASEIYQPFEEWND
jgi:Zn-dependent peptidase ImmA (M78 family)